MVALSHLLVEGIVWTVDLLQGENLGLTLLVKRTMTVSQH